MTATPDDSTQSEQAQSEQAQSDYAEKENPGAELGLSDEATTFEPEEDPEAAG